MRYALSQDVSRAPELDPDLSSIASNVHQALVTVADQQGVPDIEVSLIWTSDFVATTQEVMDAAGPNDDSVPTFDVERLGGIVAAKNIPLNEESSQVAIVVNADAVSVAANELTVGSIFLLAHELAHPILNRMRSSSGVLDGVVFPSETATELARSITRGTVDEYRADIIASIVLGLYASGEQDGQNVPLHHGHVFGGVDSYRAQIAEVVTTHVYPGWPSLVDDYRSDHVDLDTMWRTIVAETDQIFTLLGHAQACEDSADTSGPFTDSFVVENSGAPLYLEPAWQAISEALQANKVIPDMTEFANVDLTLTEVGEAAIKQMWSTLGLTFDEGPDRTLYIHVSDPTW